VVAANKRTLVEEQVKLEFSDTPGVYNGFLKIMNAYKSEAIGVRGVVQRTSHLFNGHPSLIQAFNNFLPQGHRIEYDIHDNQNSVRLTTPDGTSTIFQLSQPRCIGHESHERQGAFDNSPGLSQPPNLAQPGGLGGLPEQQGGMKRVEFKDAISYINKIKVS
jgi:paired amphipathic helix protein Sin3a